MTTAVYRSSPAMSLPLTQNTAPVLEFNCLYTHDAHKKRRKWQDGFLRFHTFNKRVMVYDIPRNFIGDVHWAGYEAVQDGDEITLQQGGVLVQVGESVGQTQTDLTELRKSKSKTKGPSSSSSPVRAAQMARTQSTTGLQRTSAQAPLKHKSLNTLLGTSRGPIGKAQLPTKSPFEERHARMENEEWENGRAPKRSRVEIETRPNASETPRGSWKGESQAPLWARTADAAKRKAQTSTHENYQQSGTKEVIDLSSDAPTQDDHQPGFSDDMLERSPMPPSKARLNTDHDAPVRSSSPAFQVQELASDRNRKAADKQTGPDMDRRSAGDDRTEQHKKAIGKVAAESPSAQRRQKVPSGTQHDVVDNTSIDTTFLPKQIASTGHGQTLRLSSTGRRKRTLLCHDQLMKPAREASTTTAEANSPSSLSQTTHDDQIDRGSTLRDKVEARLAQINAKRKVSKRSRVTERHVDSRPNDLRKGTGHTVDSSIEMQEEPVLESADDGNISGTGQDRETSATRLARLDGLMLPPAAPRPAIVHKPQPEVSRGGSVSPAKETRTLRRVLSDTAQPTKPKRIPGAPVRYTPSPTRRSRESTPASGSRDRQTTPVPAGGKPTKAARSTPDRTAYRKKGPLQKCVSLNMTSNGTSTVILSKPFHAPGKANPTLKRTEEPKDLGPWSREAFDLFTWRPPGWNEDAWCLGEEEGSKNARTGEIASETRADAAPPPGLSGGTALPMFGRPVV
ncbi:hypothetical protein CKM354_000845700 [Cercospora kikuchii]|uniref:5'-3' DNA helicase ZGRF1-like N-terminal domain-containing protein n=1 Tax=Cercospora kikuchii TaxID=84275 RepID=A0A9P3FJF6_9PEZI|nr:uncharacterized protein CKM354_000845700 [Cercospora kikuchii]GIZ45284.1 hypothetical protein CKM354_000845700 [Cercospora kikuchii]